MMSHHLLLRAAYLVAVLMVLNALVDVSLAVLPLALGEATWRFSAVGMLSRNVISLIVGALLAGGVAAVAGDRRVLRLIGVVCAAGALGLLILAGGFALDAAQVRVTIQPAARAALNMSAAGALLKLVLGATVLVALALGTFASSRSVGRAEMKEREDSAGVLVVRAR